MNNKHFTLIVVGENPDELVKKYDGRKSVDPYVVYKFKDAELYRQKYIKMYEQMLSMMEQSDPEYLDVEETLNDIKEQDSTDFYLDLTDAYEIDETTGNAISRRNPYGKYDGCSVAKNFAVPLIDINGNEIFSARKKDIRWDEVHLANRYTYEFVWDSVMEGKKPQNEDEEKLYENMKNRTEYLRYFGTKENYISSNTAFWGYAFLSDNIEWTELTETISQTEWINNFYDRFIKPLGDNEKITIYECLRIS